MRVSYQLGCATFRGRLRTEGAGGSIPLAAPADVGGRPERRPDCPVCLWRWRGKGVMWIIRPDRSRPRACAGPWAGRTLAVRTPRRPEPHSWALQYGARGLLSPVYSGRLSCKGPARRQCQLAPAWVFDPVDSGGVVGATTRRALMAMTTTTTILLDHAIEAAEAGGRPRTGASAGWPVGDVTVQDLLRQRAGLPAGHPDRVALRTRSVEAGLPLARRLAGRYTAASAWSRRPPTRTRTHGRRAAGRTTTPASPAGSPRPGRCPPASGPPAGRRPAPAPTRR